MKRGSGGGFGAPVPVGVMDVRGALDLGDGINVTMPFVSQPPVLVAPEDVSQGHEDGNFDSNGRNPS